MELRFKLGRCTGRFLVLGNHRPRRRRADLAGLQEPSSLCGPPGCPERAKPHPKARVVLGMNVTPEALPSDIPSAAWQRWLAGDVHGALRLLYAGSLSWMIQPGGLPIRESDTEGDCVRHSSKLDNNTQSGYFQTLTNAWVRNAYGRKAPATPEMEQFVKQWPFIK